MSILEFIAQRGLIDRVTINRHFGARGAEMIEREISFLSLNGLIQRCQTCTELKYELTDRGKESLPNVHL